MYHSNKLSKTSRYLPEVGECDACPYVNQCNDGEKCIVTSKHRDRRAYYQQNKDKLRVRKMTESRI